MTQAMSGTQISSENTAISVRTFIPTYSLKPQPKTKRVMNTRYIEWIKTLPCLVCQSKFPSDPHHVVPEGHGGKGVKVDDTRTIPLCHEHHMEYHTQGRRTFASKYGCDYEDIVARLNNVWNNMEAMDGK